MTECKKLTSNDRFPIPPEKLLPCAWCGGKAKIEYCNGSYGERSVKIQCCKCGVKTLPYSWGCGRYNEKTQSWQSVTETDAIEQAVKVWNTRAAANY